MASSSRSPFGKTHLAPINVENAKLGGYLPNGAPGLSLTVSEDRALTAVTTLIRHRSTGSLVGRQWQPVAGQRVLASIEQLPVVRFSWADYDLAFGLTAAQRRQQGKMTQHARNALWSLAGQPRDGKPAKRWAQFEYRRRYNGGSTKVLRHMSRLFKLDEEPRENGDEATLVLIPSPFLIEGTGTASPDLHYVKKDTQLHAAISTSLKTLFGLQQNRYPELHLLIGRILTQRRETLEEDVSRLEILLRLRHVRSRRERIERINRAVAIAHHLGYLTDAPALPLPPRNSANLTLTVNPTRIGSRRKKTHPSRVA